MVGGGSPHPVEAMERHSVKCQHSAFAYAVRSGHQAIGGSVPHLPRPVRAAWSCLGLALSLGGAHWHFCHEDGGFSRESRMLTLVQGSVQRSGSDPRSTGDWPGAVWKGYDSLAGALQSLPSYGRPLRWRCGRFLCQASMRPISAWSSRSVCHKGGPVTTGERRAPWRVPWRSSGPRWVHHLRALLCREDSDRRLTRAVMRHGQAQGAHPAPRSDDHGRAGHRDRPPHPETLYGLPTAQISTGR